MAWSKHRRLRRRTASLAVAALVSLSAMLYFSKDLFADRALADGQGRGSVPQAIGFTMAAAANPIPQPQSIGPTAGIPGSGSFTAGHRSTWLDESLDDRSFPQIFGVAMTGGIYASLQKSHDRKAMRPLRSVNLPAAEGSVALAATWGQAQPRRRAASDTLLFALIFKDGQEAWSARAQASMFPSDIAGGRTSRDGDTTCRRGELCNLSAGPIPGALWLFTAVLVGLIAVGSRRQQHPQ